MNKNELIELVITYADKVFFYCVKRCNSRMDAEDLSQTILLETIDNINKGARIDNLDYYIWGVCKNQYNMYLRRTMKDKKHIDFVKDIDKIDDSKTALEEMIEEEKIRRMNQAIKLLSKDYAEILYAYYIEDKTLKFIAEELKLPLGTVKWKLSVIRDKLKEYLDMEKLNGKKAYVPKEFTECLACYNIGTYNPYDDTKSLINKNLLYHSYNNPCSLEDYSIELGISMPYIKDIVNHLVNSTLLKKTEDGKYLTNFPYITKEILANSNNILLDNYKEYANELIVFAKNHIDEYRELTTYAKLDNKELMWSFSLYLNYIVLNDVKPSFSYHKRPGNGAWDFYMTDLMDMNELIYDMSINTYKDGADKINAYTFVCANDTGRLAFNKSANGRENYTLFNELLYQNHCQYDVLVNRIHPNLKKEIDEYIAKGFLKVQDEYIKFNFPFFTYHDFKKVEKLMYSKELDIAKEKLQMIIDKLVNNLRDYLPEYLNDYTNSLISNQLWNIQSLVIESFKEANMLDLKEKEEYFPYNMIMITSDVNETYEK